MTCASIYDESWYDIIGEECARSRNDFVTMRTLDAIVATLKSIVLNVRPSVLVCDVEETAFHCGLCGRKFVLRLFGQFPRLGNICHSWQHIGVVWGLHQSTG